MREEQSENTVEQPGELFPFVFIVEIGSSLAYLLKKPDTPAFVPAVNQVRDDLSREWGIKLPPFLIRENREMDPDSYRFILYDKEILSRRTHPGKTMIMSSRDRLARIPGQLDSDPIYSRPCVWLEPDESIVYAGTEPYSASTGEVIVEHLQAVLRSNAAEFITSEVVREKLSVLHSFEPALVKKILGRLTLPGLVSILKNLVPEGIPLTEMGEIIRSLAEADFSEADPDLAAENLRNMLKNYIHNYAFRDRLLLFAVPDSRIQLWLYNRAGRNNRIPDNDPVAEFLVKELTSLHLSFQGKGFRLGVICSAPVRLALRRILERRLPDVVVLKPDEIDSDKEIMVVRKIRCKGLRLWLSWNWFWMTATPERKERFKEEMEYFLDFLKEHKKDNCRQAPPRALPAPNLALDFYSPKKVNLLADNTLPMPITLSRRQKAAIILLGCQDGFLKEVFGNLNTREIINVAMEMANLPVESTGLIRDVVADASERSEFSLQPTSIANYIRASFPKDEFKLNLSPLQKMAVLISSLSHGTAEEMYKRVLADMSGGELEGLAASTGKNQILSLHETRNIIMDEFFWYLKGRFQPNTLFTSKYWMGELQRIAVRSPRRFVVATKELWLTSGLIQARFERFVNDSLPNASFWIRRFIAKKNDEEPIMRLAEKALIITQLLPGELSQEMTNRLGGIWKKIFQNVPRPTEGPDPVQSGTVLSQFLSHYYSSYDNVRSSRVEKN